MSFLRRVRRSPARMPGGSFAYWVGPSGLTAMDAKTTGNPAWDRFMGIETDESLATLGDTPGGWAKAYKASVWAFRCIRLRARVLKAVPLEIVNEATDEVVKHPLTRALGNHNNRLRYVTECDRQVYGKAFWTFGLDPHTRGGWIRRVNPQTVEIIAEPTGQIEFRQVLGGVEVARWQPGQIAYFSDYDPNDDFGSISPTETILRSAGVLVNISAFAEYFFANDAMPAGILVSENPIMPADRERVLAEWRRNYQGVDKAHGTALLDGGKITYQPITPPLKDLAMVSLREEERRDIAAAYGVPMSIAQAAEAALYASKQDYTNFYNLEILPGLDDYADTINEQILPYFGQAGVIVRPKTDDIEALQEDRTEITQRNATAVSGRYMSMNEAREREQLDKLPVDYFVLGDRLVRREDIEAGNLDAINPAAPTQPSLFGMSADIPEPQRRLRLPAPRKAVLQAPSVCVMLRISDKYGVVRGAQRYIQTTYPDLEIEWENADKFHITLVYLNNPLDPQGLVSRLPRDISLRFDLGVGPVGSFPAGPDGTPLFMSVERADGLLKIQRSIFDYMAGEGELSAFSTPESWTPHITLGYLKSGAVPQCSLTGRVDVDALWYSVDPGNGLPYQDVINLLPADSQPPRIIDLPPQKAIVEIIVNTKPESADPAAVRQAVLEDTALRDLKRWQKKVATKGADVPFTPDYLPDAITAFLRSDLDSWDGETDRETWIKTAFTRAEAALQGGEQTATPEEFEAYWNGIGKLFDAISTTFEQLWQGIPARLAGALRTAGAQGAEASIQSLLSTLTQETEAALLGTTEQPGPLVQVVLAGAARGNDLLKAPGQKDALTIDWSVIDVQAREWAKQYAGSLVRGVNDTTLDIFRTKVSEWINAGGSLEDLAKYIEGDLTSLDIPPGWSEGKIKWATSRARARLIAQTESTTAFTEGAYTRWEQAAVPAKKWRTQNDTRVDDVICLKLHNVKAKLREDWLHPNGKRYGMPAHPGCILPGNGIVIPGDLQAAAQSFYVGRAVEISLLSGRRITVTLNHPILTRSGWVAAQFLSEGDDVISTFEGQGIAATVNPNHHYRPTAIEQIYHSFKVSGGVSTITMIASPEDFYGDGKSIESNIEVVYAHRFLLSERQPGISEPVGQDILNGGNSGLIALSSNGAPLEEIGIGRLAPYGIVRFIQHGIAHFGGSVLPSAEHGIRDGSDFNAGLNQPGTEKGSGQAVLFSQSQFSFPGAVSGNDFGKLGNFTALAGDNNPGLTDSIGQHSVVDPRLAGEFLNRFSAQVAVDPVISIRHFDYSGHVYDLQVGPYELYICNGVIVKNCRCFPAPEMESLQ